MKKGFTQYINFDSLRDIKVFFRKPSRSCITGFTLIELLVIIGIMLVLAVIALPAFLSFQQESDLNDSAEEIVNTLRLAQSKTISSEGASSWGVYFATSAEPHQYTLFKGADYVSRATSSDEVHNLPATVEIYEINFTPGAASSIVFERLTGKVSLATTTQSVSLRLKADFQKTRTIYIESFGLIR